jgi:hypothetical protein
LSIVPINYGRQQFDDSFLKVEIPTVPALDKSVVLMVGDEATAYIVPQFPASTRFVRICSNFISPGRNAKLDAQIRNILDQYDSSRTLIYYANEKEMNDAPPILAYFGIAKENRPCREIKSQTGNKGYLCQGSQMQKQAHKAANASQFRNVAGVKLAIAPREVPEAVIHAKQVGVSAIDVFLQGNADF